jgi:hypothetical protein
MIKNCFLCQTEVVFNDGEDVKRCDSCGCENDRPFNNEPKLVKEPIPMTTQEEWLNKRETQQQEVKVVKVASSNSLSPFFKKGMLQEGAVGVIKGEFAPSGKFNNYTGEVDFEGTIIKVSFSKTSLYDVVKAYGDDTASWIGKQIVYSVEDIENKKTNALFRGCNVFRAFR